MARVCVCTFAVRWAAHTRRSTWTRRACCQTVWAARDPWLSADHSHAGDALTKTQTLRRRAPPHRSSKRVPRSPRAGLSSGEHASQADSLRENSSLKSHEHSWENSAAALHAAPTLLPVFESRMSVLLGNRGQRKLPSGREARASLSHQVAAVSRATMDRGPNGAGAKHQTDLCSLCHSKRPRVRRGRSHFPFPVSCFRSQDGTCSQIPEDALCQRGDWRRQRCVWI